MAERKRTGIAISGVDIASPDHSVTDGKCEQLHNMRYANGAWRNVHPFVIKHKLRTSPNYAFNIIYQHPATKDNQYIAESTRTEKITSFYAYVEYQGQYLYYFTNETIKVYDAIYDDEKEYLGIVTSVSDMQKTITVEFDKEDASTYTIELERIQSEDIGTNKTSHFISLVEIVNEDIELVQNIYSIDEDTEVAVSHFGKVLLVSDKTNKKLLYFILKGEQYKQINWDELSCQSTIKVVSWNSPNVKTINVEESEDNSLPDYGFTEAGLLAYEQMYEGENPNPTFITFDEELNAWRGEIAIFFALRDESGATLYTTSPQILRSTLLIEANLTPDIIDIGGLGVVDDVDVFAYAGYKNISANLRPGTTHPYAAPFHKLMIPTAKLEYNIGDSEVIKEIAIYSTRLYSLLDTNGENRVDLLQEPFYLMDTITINPKVSEGLVEYDITYSKLKNVEQKVLYAPTISPQLLYADKFTEYNNRLHLISPERMLRPLKSDNIVLDSENGTEFLIVKWGNDSGSTIYSAAPNKYSFSQGFLISFPQNVDSIYWANSYEDRYEVFGKLLNLKYNAAIDTSYYTNLIPKPNADRIQAGVMANYIFYKYNTDLDVSIPDEYVTSVESVLSTTDSNRIQASSANNCFEYPYENSYRVGSETSHIIAANSAAVEMSDAKFGEFPLYVFTDEGVFAMQSGGNDALYSAIIPISYDKAIQPNTLAVNYNVLFVTKEGIMALSSQGVRQLSQELDNLNGNLPEWMKTTQLLHLPRFNEIVATDFADKKLYVYSASQQVWSSRDVEPGRLLNNGEIVADNNTIYNLLSEDDNTTNTEVTILTRPIKLGSMELKRLETFILRFEASTAQTIEIQLYGSTDTVNWIKFREVSVYTNRDIIIRRVPLSAKYLRVEITGAVTDDIRIIAMEMEYYLRMLHRMR